MIYKKIFALVAMALCLNFLQAKQQVEVVNQQTDNISTDTIATQNQATTLEGVDISFQKNIKNYNVNTPLSSQLLTQSDIKTQNNVQDFVYVLDQTPSVYTSSYAGNGMGYAEIRMRGNDTKKLNVSINGMPYNDPESFGVYFADVPNLASFSSVVQIERGVGSSPNGGSSLGGSINVITNDDSWIHDPKKIKNNLSQSYIYGSYNTHKYNAGLKMFLNGRFKLDVSLTKTYTDGYIDRAFVDLYSLYTSLSYKINNKSILTYNFIDGIIEDYISWNGLAGHLLKTDRTYNSAGIEIGGEIKKTLPYDKELDRYHQQHHQLIYSSNILKHISIKNIVFITLGWGQGQNYKHADLVNYNLQDGLKSDLVRQTHFDNIHFGNLFSVLYKAKTFDLSYAFNAQRYQAKRYANLLWIDKLPDVKNYKYYGDFPSDKTELSEYIKLNYNLSPSILLFIDLQHRSVFYNINGFNDDPIQIINQQWHFFNPKTGFTFYNKYYKTFVSLAVSNKEPNRDDFQYATELPKPETLYNIEYGNLLRTKNFSYQLTSFLMLYKNQLVYTGELDQYNTASVRKNVGNSYRYGFENEINYQATKHLIFSLNYTYSVNQNLDYVNIIPNEDSKGFVIQNLGKTQISFSPSHIAGYSISYNFLDKDYLNARLVVQGKYVSEQYLDNSENTARMLNDFYLQDAFINFSKMFKIFEIEFRVNNILNKLYEPAGYAYVEYRGGIFNTYNGYNPAMGRNAYVRVVMNLDWR